VVVSMAHAASYYADNSGSPACSDALSYGTEAKPWCTLSYAIARISGGDDLYVKSGIYAETSLYISGPSGTSGKNTTIQTYPGDTVTIQGSGYNSGRVKITGSSYMTFSGFKVTKFNQGIYVENSHHITLQNCVVYDMGQEAIHVNANSDYITIENCTIHDTGKNGANGEGIYIGTGSAGPLDNTNNVIIKNNTIYSTTDEGIELKSGTYDCIVDGNTLHDINIVSSVGVIEVNEALLGVQHWDSNPNHIIRNNIIHDVNTAMRAGTGGIYYNNLIYRVNNYGIRVNNNASDSYTRKIYHNTLDVQNANAIYVVSGITDIQNNIGPSANNNLATSDSFYEDKSAGNYHLVIGSTPINAGIDLISVVPVDIEGTNRLTGDAPDLGAYEYASTPVPSPPQNLIVQ